MTGNHPTDTARPAQPPPDPGPEPSNTHLVLIPSYNTGAILPRVVLEALQTWSPVWVVIDGSTDDSPDLLRPLLDEHGPALRILRLTRNRGKGSALLHGLQAANQAGFTHTLTMDSDGQHPHSLIPRFMQLSQHEPEKMILGRPVFDADAPIERVFFRRFSNALVRLETLGGAVADSLFGLRCYPIKPTLRALEQTRFGRRFDFEAEMAVRLLWAGVEPVNVPVPVRYLSADEGGVSHFHYLRDNLWLTWMHLRLLLQTPFNAPARFFRKSRATARQQSLTV